MKFRKLFLATTLLFSLTVLSPLPVFAEKKCAGVSTSVIGCEDGKDGIEAILSLVITILTFGVGALATFGIVVSGIQYMTAQDNVEKMKKAKNRILQIVIGIFLYTVLWAFLNWLLPGGIFNGSTPISPSDPESTSPDSGSKGSDGKDSSKKSSKKTREEGTESILDSSPSSPNI